MTQPSLGGFVTFINSVMGVPPSAQFSPSADPATGYAFAAAVDTVNMQINCAPAQAGAWTPYARAVYNLAAHMLISIVQDPETSPPYRDKLPYWAWLRGRYNLNDFSPGVVQSSGDEGSSTSLQVVEVMRNLTVGQLECLRTPYGRAYLSISQSWGSMWGMS